MYKFDISLNFEKKNEKKNFAWKTWSPKAPNQACNENPVYDCILIWPEHSGEEALENNWVI